MVTGVSDSATSEKTHRHAVIVVGANLGKLQFGRRHDVNVVFAFVHFAPTLRSSVAIAARRSVSFTRQL